MATEGAAGANDDDKDSEISWRCVQLLFSKEKPPDGTFGIKACEVVSLHKAFTVLRGDVTKVTTGALMKRDMGDKVATWVQSDLCHTCFRTAGVECREDTRRQAADGGSVRAAVPRRCARRTLSLVVNVLSPQRARCCMISRGGRAAEASASSLAAVATAATLAATTAASAAGMH